MSQQSRNYGNILMGAMERETTVRKSWVRREQKNHVGVRKKRNVGVWPIYRKTFRAKVLQTENMAENILFFFKLIYNNILEGSFAHLGDFKKGPTTPVHDTFFFLLTIVMHADVGYCLHTP